MLDEEYPRACGWFRDFTVSWESFGLEAGWQRIIGVWGAGCGSVWRAVLTDYWSTFKEWQKQRPGARQDRRCQLGGERGNQSSVGASSERRQPGHFERQEGPVGGGHYIVATGLGSGG